MQVAIAFYKGKSINWRYALMDSLIRFRLSSKYSHAELVLDDKCYSSSIMDNGVRSKYINYFSGNWDIMYFDITQAEYRYAIHWFECNNGKSYDWLNILSYIIPFMKHATDKYICFEAIAEMLGIEDAANATPDSLIDYINQRNLCQLSDTI